MEKKSQKILIYIIMGLLSFAGIYSEIVMCIQRQTFPYVAEMIVTCIMIVLIAFYAVSNFKVPHGNLLKYLFLTFAVMCFVGLLATDPNSSSANGDLYVLQISRGVVVILSTYMSGRLDRIKQNTVFAVICAILLFATSIKVLLLHKVYNLVFILFETNFFILWIDLVIAYLFRYKEHKEAGLADKE